MTSEMGWSDWATAGNERHVPPRRSQISDVEELLPAHYAERSLKDQPPAITEVDTVVGAGRYPKYHRVASRDAPRAVSRCVLREPATELSETERIVTSYAVTPSADDDRPAITDAASMERHPMVRAVSGAPAGKPATKSAHRDRALKEPVGV
ncbi:Uncharacterized protein PBTT_05688 [Plasmodiophora brassicae]